MASTSSLKPISKPVLIGTNYKFWSIKWKTFLQLNKCWDMVEAEFKEPEAVSLAAMNNAQKNALEARRDRDLIATWMIQSCIEKSIFPRISGATCAHQAWNLLALAYKGTDCVKMVRMQTLCFQFESLKMKESETVDQFMTRVLGIVTQFQTYGEPIEQKIVVHNILRHLTKNFAMVVTAIEEAKNLSQFILEELTGSLLSHEAQLNQEEESLTNSFSTQSSLSRGRGRGG